MSEKEKTAGEKLAEELFYKAENIAKKAPEQVEEAAAFCEGYKNFLNKAKTEREFVSEAIAMLEANGYVPFVAGKVYQAGDKVYKNNRGKALIATTIGQKPLTEGIRLNIAHIDSPRVDLKPNPLYEKDDLALFKTHYYGGIRKYQWPTVPLAMHGVLIKEDGEKVEVVIGEKEGDPVFCITDLLPHLAAQQSQRPLKDAFSGEDLNIVIGSLPFVDESVKEPVKLMAMKLMHDELGITEKDFLRAEIEFVPAYKACDVGFDRSIVGAYGQDDKVCAYTALAAEVGEENPTWTTMTVLADKEEIGSTGNTGLNSNFVEYFIQYLAEMAGVNDKEVLEHSICLSADVNAAYDPTYPQVHEPMNACYFNKGCVLTKYTGARGKSGTNDAGAELMAKVIKIMDDAGVYWQSGELGAVDVGGGGTVAKFVAEFNIDVVDLGVPILSMHAPFELASKLDIYNTYKAFAAFIK
ncbi:MAG: aminopeptidase [bacterium]|nr:aminopeptidase [bacterium]